MFKIVLCINKVDRCYEADFSNAVCDQYRK